MNAFDPDPDAAAHERSISHPVGCRLPEQPEARPDLLSLDDLAALLVHFAPPIDSVFATQLEARVRAAIAERTAPTAGAPQHRPVQDQP